MNSPGSNRRNYNFIKKAAVSSAAFRIKIKTLFT
jgi:hypothetical protein